MENSLFPQIAVSDYLFDLEYKGPSFDGVMEITALKTEITGLEEVIRIATQILSKNKKIEFGANDIQIFIQAFEKGSFRKKVKLVLKSVKSLNEYQGAAAVAAVIISIIGIVQQHGARELKDISPQVMSQIADQTKLELLQDKKFIQSMSDVVKPLSQEGDKLICAAPTDTSAIITYQDKKEFVELSGEVLEPVEEDGDRYEILKGRINRVDLDATKRHLGFKVGDEGSSIYATLSDQIRQTLDMKNLLGQWVEIKGTTTYRGGYRDHIFIQSLKVIEQQQLNFVSAAK